MRWLLAVSLVACGSSSSTPIDAAAQHDATQHATVTLACMHICQCEAGGPDPTCQTDCTGGGGTTSSSLSSTSSTSTSLSSTSVPTSTSSTGSTTASNGELVTADQACIDCFNTAACSDIMNGTACASTCN